MKTTIKLSPEQIQQIIKLEKEILTRKYEADLLALETKYEYLEVEIPSIVETPNLKRIKLTDELFIQLWNEGKTENEIVNESGYNPFTVSQKKKKLVNKGLINDR